MKAPFVLPAQLTRHGVVEDATGYMTMRLFDISANEEQFVMYAINNVNRFADAIVELQAATDAEMGARPGSALVHHYALRRLLDARRTITQLANELSTKE